MHRQTSRRPDPARNQVTARLQSLLGRAVPEAGRGRPGPIDPLLKLAIVCALAGLIAVPLHYGLSPFLVEFDELVVCRCCARCSSPAARCCSGTRR
ncbi:hypothetical protein OV079_12680 [Nannocystis pusilla]|uniref:Uncharacterized protein n=1 Tax=Nannocystis pusilla TaxID=889268 RepID=A0A9X3IWY0_9BACT|nr:hypothetical protein [Nannocystis pusilla]MCY1006400.1 hypothetical protein [Nannocystis pusilla]